MFEELKARRLSVPAEASAQEFVCWSCHNGAVKDSRRVLARGGQHPVGLAVARATDRRFPLYGGKKRLECGTCHGPHGQQSGATSWLRVADEIDTPCLPCHADKSHFLQGKRADPDLAANVRARGGRLGDDGRIGCRTCHTPHGAEGPKLLLLAPASTAGGNGLCELCHQALAVAGKVKDGPQPCADCHGAHLDSPKGFRGGAEGPCLGCHSAQSGPGHHPTSGREGCLECHAVHKPVRTDKGPGAFLRSFDVAALLCQRCHADRMARHGIATKIANATKKLISQKGFGPTADDGSLYCATCHAVHKAPQDRLLRRPAQILCLYCHEAENPYGPAGEKGTHPVGVFLTRSQRAALGNRAAPPREGEEDEESALSCSACHRAHEPAANPKAPCGDCHAEQAKAPLHGKEKNGCVDCHDIHASRMPAGRCTLCHTGVAGTMHPQAIAMDQSTLPLFDAEGRQKPAGLIACPTCHDPHAGRKKMLRADAPQELCFACHPRKDDMSKNVHFGAYLPAGNNGRKPSAWPGDACLPCHAPHEPPNVAQMFNGRDPASRTCRGCHGETHTSLPAHTFQGMPPWKQLTADLPLFGPLGARDKVGFISCPTCHDVHAPGNSFRLSYKDPPELCLACHRDAETLLGTPHDPAKRGSKERCTSCHPLHSEGERPNAWNLRVQGAGTWNDRKCLPCHLAGPIEDSPYHGLYSHPVNVEAEAGPGLLLPLPLYDAMGNKGGKRVACATCHDIHGARRPDGEPTPDFLRLDPSDGSLCRSCHPQEGSVSGTPHDFSAREPMELGPCAPCHVAHRASYDLALWGIKLGNGDWLPNRLCRSCHTVESRDPERGPLLQYHMKDADTWFTERGTIYLQRPMTLVDEYAIRRGKNPVIPLFNKEGEAGPHGNLQCLSCHEPHQWSPLGPTLKPGTPIGKNVPTRFTRLKDPSLIGSSVCADCHDKDTESYLRRYHEVWEDVGAEFNPLLFQRERD